MSLQRQVLMQLRDLILGGALPPGARLTELHLAKRLNASRTPVRAALVSLEQEGLIDAGGKAGYVVRQFTAEEVADAIAVRGQLEGMAARLVAEHGMGRQLASDLQACLGDGDRVVAARSLAVEEYAPRYSAMNERFHGLVIEASGNRALQRAVALNSKLPFASASALLPMHGASAFDRDSMAYAHRQHHMLFDAMARGEGARAQALATEHVEVARVNLRQALEHADHTLGPLAGIRLVARS